ncbi:MATE family efflux transporter [Oribacterium sp. P6A1]|uniref:MATE family efflux transporter n=1 Tax=Oribacterium sp. P6A1 TaxID=1410612 RepID=UPI0005677F19|nr:MATE family efflux transporter [Oribacterium sp. P6A1]
MAQHNLSKGNLLHNMIWFSLPYLLSFFLQTLYGLADLLIAGQFNGADVISAVSIGSQVMHMVTVMLVGLAMGSTVMIGQFVGAEDEKKVSRAIGNTVTLFAGVAAVVTVLLLMTIHPIVSALSTPIEAVTGTVSYLTICFAGIPFIVAYNILSSIFRGMGDSKSPLMFIAIACFVNIVLDFVFMGPMHMGASGAAYGTILAQGVSVIIAFTAIVKKKLFEVHLSDLRPDRFVLEKILGVGVPIACQDGFIQISFILITVIANQRGVDISAAVGIVEKTISFLFLVPSSMLSTVSTIVAQSVGAGDRVRARNTLKYGVIMSFSVGVFFAVLFQFISPWFFRMFTNDPVVKEYAVQYMQTYVIDCAVAGVHFPFSGFFSACNMSILGFIHNILSVVFVRVPGAWLATKMYPETLYAMGLAAPAGSFLSVIICVLFYLHYKNKGKF